MEREENPYYQLRDRKKTAKRLKMSGKDELETNIPGEDPSLFDIKVLKPDRHV